VHERRLRLRPDGDVVATKKAVREAVDHLVFARSPHTRDPPPGRVDALQGEGYPSEGLAIDHVDRAQLHGPGGRELYQVASNEVKVHPTIQVVLEAAVPCSAGRPD